MARKERIIALLNQGPIDLAIQAYGGVEGLFLFLDDNPEVDGATGALTSGQVLHAYSDPIDQDISDFYDRNDLHPITGLVIDVHVPGDYNQDFNDDFNNQT